MSWTKSRLKRQPRIDRISVSFVAQDLYWQRPREAFGSQAPGPPLPASSDHAHHVPVELDLRCRLGVGRDPQVRTRVRLLIELTVQNNAGSWDQVEPRHTHTANANAVHCRSHVASRKLRPVGVSREIRHAIKRRYCCRARFHRHSRAPPKPGVTSPTRAHSVVGLERRASPPTQGSQHAPTVRRQCALQRPGAYPPATCTVA